MNEDDRNLSRSQWNLVFVILAVTFASIIYRILVAKELEHTSLLFIGIPAALAVVVAFTPKAKTVTGSILRAMTIALLISGILLGEGFICILMAAPLFYAIGVVIGVIIDQGRKRNRATLSCIVVLGLLPMSFEGAIPSLSFPRNEAVTVERIVDAPAAEVEQTLAQSPHFDAPLPLYLRLRFPRPLEARGDGLVPGSLRMIHFSGSEAGHSGDLVLKVTDYRPGYVRFVPVSDHTHITHWLSWRDAQVHWSAVDSTHTRVEWTLVFRRRLDPAWYFRPWERYAVRLAAEYLITTNATPGVAHTAR